jgi:hypothetical protein
MGSALAWEGSSCILQQIGTKQKGLREVFECLFSLVSLILEDYDLPIFFKPSLICKKKRKPGVTWHGRKETMHAVTGLAAASLSRSKQTASAYFTKGGRKRFPVR